MKTNIFMWWRVKFKKLIFDKMSEACSIIWINIYNKLSKGLKIKVKRAKGYMINVIIGTKYKFINGDKRFNWKKLLINIGALARKAIKEIARFFVK